RGSNLRLLHSMKLPARQRTDWYSFSRTRVGTGFGQLSANPSNARACSLRASKQADFLWRKDSVSWNGPLHSELFVNKSKRIALKLKICEYLRELAIEFTLGHSVQQMTKPGRASF